MIKIIDVDKLFDGYISDYVYKNIGKVKPETIENEMPLLYEKFGKEPLKELNGKTPETFYRDFSAKEMTDCLCRHIESGVPVSDFLCEALIDSDSEDALVDALQTENEEVIAYVMNILNDKNSVKPLSRYMEFILWDYGENVRELAAEILGDHASDVAERVLKEFPEAAEDKKVYLTEILCRAPKDDRIFAVLIGEFLKHLDNIPLYAGYLARYGDEKALPYLLTAIENDKINYNEFQELKFAIEKLGSEYEKKRDFTKDALYRKIKGEKPQDKPLN